MPAQTVAAFLSTLVHARKAEIERVREIIRKAEPTLSEQIKWNAPSFGPAGEDRITFRLQPGDLVELILHRGAKVKDTAGFVFEDESGLARRLAPDRFLVAFKDMADIEAKAKPLAGLLKRWLKAAG